MIELLKRISDLLIRISKKIDKKIFSVDELIEIQEYAPDISAEQQKIKTILNKIETKDDLEILSTQLLDLSSHLGSIGEDIERLSEEVRKAFCYYYGKTYKNPDDKLVSNPNKLRIAQEEKKVTLYSYNSYLLKRIGENIVCNDGSMGIFLYDKNLNEKDFVALKCNHPRYLFTNNQNNTVFLYSADPHEMVYVSFAPFERIIIPVPKELGEECFTAFYHWDNTSIILVDWNGNFHQASWKDKTIIPISKNIVARKYPNFYQLYETSKEYDILTVYPERGQFIFDLKEENKLGMFDINTNETVYVERPNDPSGINDYKNGMFACLDRHQVLILGTDGKNAMIIPALGCEFNYVQFLDDESLVILEGNNTNNDTNLIKYKIK